MITSLFLPGRSGLPSWQAGSGSWRSFLHRGGAGPRSRSFGIWRWGQEMVNIGDENDQVKEGHLVNALACTGDEGRDTLR